MSCYFRAKENAKRMSDTAKRLLIPPVPEEMFVDALKKTIKANLEWIPPYGHGASLYIRPVLFGVGENLGLKTATGFVFRIFVCPVGPYYKSGKLSLVSMAFIDSDRTAPRGIGQFKAGANYAGGLNSTLRAKALGADEVIYLDPKRNRYLDEAGSANLIVKMKDDEFATPKSETILSSITRRSIMTLAENELGLRVKEREIDFLDEYQNFEEIAACGTAAVISPIGKIFLNGNWYKFYDNGNSVGPVMTKLYEKLTAIQIGDKEDIYGWTEKIE